ncbi:MAG: hypothetical protein EA393_01195 [Bacteroidetes bacterium]|nr:MAG: hypothetical protein EA393_01195 [Bacteroidota bacterium]
MRLFRLVLVPFFTLGFFWPQTSSADNEVLKRTLLESITSDQVMSYVYELTDPRNKGRLAGYHERCVTFTISWSFGPG